MCVHLCDVVKRRQDYDQCIGGSPNHSSGFLRRSRHLNPSTSQNICSYALRIVLTLSAMCAPKIVPHSGYGRLEIPLAEAMCNGSWPPLWCSVVEAENWQRSRTDEGGNRLMSVPMFSVELGGRVPSSSVLETCTFRRSVERNEH